jgi:predicted GIY-YIG superfamily endonuclease
VKHYVYRLYGDDGQLWYIGFTGNVAERLANHRSSRKPWARYARYRATEYDSYEDALAGERQAIHDEQPLFNGTRPKPRPARQPQAQWTPTPAEEERIRKEVDNWPPLTPAQRDKLALILRPDSQAGDSDTR